MRVVIVAVVLGVLLIALVLYLSFRDVQEAEQTTGWMDGALMVPADFDEGKPMFGPCALSSASGMWQQLDEHKCSAILVKSADEAADKFITQLKFVNWQIGHRHSVEVNIWDTALHMGDTYGQNYLVVVEVRHLSAACPAEVCAISPEERLFGGGAGAVERCASRFRECEERYLAQESSSDFLSVPKTLRELDLEYQKSTRHRKAF